MCGIVGYVGKSEKKEILLDGLKELEYRGYDSAGIAVATENGLHSFKAVGKLENLERKTANFSAEGFGVAIGHTRWATHGKPTELNAHPHLGKNSYVVHNGIIENYQEIKKELQAEGVEFLSQTDTEVIVHLFERYNQEFGNPFEAFKKTLQRLEGAYAILLISQSANDTIFFAKNGSPMLIGFGDDGIYFASSDTAIIGKANEVYYLEDGEYGFVKENEVALFNSDGAKEFSKKPLESDKLSAQKDGYRFFMEKEIYEQSDVITDTMLGRLKDDSIEFEELDSRLFDGINESSLMYVTLCVHVAATSLCVL